MMGNLGRMGNLGLTLSKGGVYAGEIGIGARLIVDFQGAKNGQPYYWYNGTRYASPANIPGWTFSRASAGYAETTDGRLVAFGVNEPRITDKGLLVEAAGTNVIPYSQNIGGVAWVLRASYSIVSTGLPAPDGTLTARRLQNSGNVTATEGTFSNVTTGVSNGSYAVAIYARAGSLSTARLILKNANSDTIVAQSVLTLTSSWQRFYLVGTTGGPQAGIRAEITTNGENGTIDLWQADAQPGGFITSPIFTNGSAATRAADSASITGLGSILGQFRTNTLTQSQTFSGPEWAKVGAQIALTDNVATAPDGTMTAAQFSIVGSGTAVRALYKSSATGNQQAYVTGQTYTQSWFVKVGTGIRYVHIPLAHAGFPGSWYANFDLQTATVTATAGSVTPGITAVGNGWYRVAVTATAYASSAAADGGYIYAVSSGTATFGSAGSFSGGETMFVWGADRKTGTLSDYIPTTATPVSAGNPVTLGVSGETTGDTGSLDQYLVSISNGSFSTMMGLRRSAINLLGPNSRVDGVWNTDPGQVGGKSGRRVLKVAGRLRANALRGAADGALMASGAITVSPSVSVLAFGNDTPGGGQPLNGYVQHVKVFGDLTDAQLQGLTS